MRAAPVFCGAACFPMRSQSNSVTPTPCTTYCPPPPQNPSTGLHEASPPASLPKFLPKGQNHLAQHRPKPVTCYPAVRSAGTGGGQRKTPCGRRSGPSHLDMRITACTKAFGATKSHASSKTFGV